MDNLKPCPFCGGEAAIKEFDDGSGGVFCTKCKFRPLTHATYNRLEDKQRAIDNWNRRPDSWIPVSEKMPRAYHAVLVYCPEYMNAYCASLNADGQWLYFAQDVSRIVGERVTHWMPLPEPPKEGKA